MAFAHPTWMEHFPQTSTFVGSRHTLKHGWNYPSSHLMIQDAGLAPLGRSHAIEQPPSDASEQAHLAPQLLWNHKDPCTHSHKKAAWRISIFPPYAIRQAVRGKSLRTFYGPVFSSCPK